MERDKILLVVASVISGAILLALGYFLGETTGLVIAAGFFLLILLLWGAYQTSYVILSEMEVGILFDRHDNFICFFDNEYGRIPPLPPGADPEQRVIHKYSKPLVRHRINPATEVFKGTLRKGSFSAKGISKDARTREGIPVTIPWSVSFRIEVLRIQPGIEYKMARALPKNAPNMVTGRMTQIIQHVVGQKGIEALYATPTNDGAIKKLEDEIREELLTRAKAIGITGIAGHDLKIGPISLPRKIEATLHDAHQRQLHTNTVAKTLNTLREAVSAFTFEDMERLTELERLRIIDEKTKSLILTESFSRKEKNVRFSDSEPGQDNGQHPKENGDTAT